MKCFSFREFRKSFLLAVVLLIIATRSFAQCNSASGISGGNISPSSAWQNITSVSSGVYYTFTADMCTAYTFSFCSADGGNCSWDTQITITKTSGVPATGGYNNDYCSTQSRITDWVPAVNGTYRVFITNYNCLNTGGSGATLAYITTPAYSSNVNFAYDDNATIGNSQDCIQLTANTSNQTGCAWELNSSFNFLSDFSYDFTINMGNIDGGGDGIAFVMQNDSRGYCSCGVGGGSFGAGGILNSVIIEIDTYINSEDRDDGLPTVLCSGGPDQDHIDLWLNGNINPAGIACPAPAGARIIPAAIPLMNSGSSYNIENGLDHIFRISWTTGSPGTLVASVLDASGMINYATLSYAFDPLTAFGTNTPYFGFTGGTGLNTNSQSFCIPAVLLPIQLLSFTANQMENGMVDLLWSTASETEDDFFTVQESADAANWQTVGVLKAAGNSFSQINYSLIDSNPIAPLSYYRLKQTDLDGKFRYSSLVSILVNQTAQNNLIVFPNPFSTSLQLLHATLNETGSITLVDVYGKKITEKNNVYLGNIISIMPDENLPDGIYFLIVDCADQHFVNRVVKEDASAR